jgi:hypothetical protein
MPIGARLLTGELGVGLMRRLIVLTVVAVTILASPVAAKGSKGPSAKKLCQEAHFLSITANGLSSFSGHDLALIGDLANNLGKVKLKGADTKALAQQALSANSFATQLAAAQAITDACAAAHVIPAPPTTTTTTTTPPQQASGQSDSVVNITYPSSKAALLHATYQGDSNFVVTGFDATGGQGELFVNTIGHYDGVRLMNVDTQSTPARLQVQASGPWSIAITAATGAPVATSPGHFDGIGDQAILVHGSASTGHFHNTGDANFVVNSYSASNRQLLVNEIGAFDGMEIIPTGTILMEVQSNGGWSIDLS